MSVDGANHTVTISTANKIGLVVFDGTAGQKVSLGVNAVTPGSGNNLHVFNPDGSTLTWTSTTTSNTNFHMTLPTTGTYTLMLDPDGTNTGSATLTLSSEVNAGTIVIDGASATITTTRVGQRGYLTFSGTAGQKVSLGVNAVTPGSGNNLHVFNPDGSTLTWTSTTTSNTNFHMTLPTTGTYTLMLDPDGINTGSASLTLSSEVNAGTIVIDGASATVTTTRVGQRGYLTFSGTAGQKVSLGVNAITPGSGNDLYVFNPDGSTLTWTSTTTTNTNFHMTLPATGSYTLMLDPDGTNTGSASLTLSSEVNAGTIVIDGASATTTTTRVGQRGYLTFSGTAGQKVSLGVNAITPGSGNDLYVFNPDGSTLTWTSTTTTNTNFHMTLPTTGTYTIMLDPDGTNTGSATLTLSSEVDGGTVTTNGPSVPITISRVGQRARLTFGGTVGQQAIVRLTSNSMGSVTVALLKPDGTQLTWSTSSGASFDLSMQTLPTTGTYTILVDPAGTNTGSINVAVIIPVSLTLSFNGKIRDRVGQGNAAINPDGSLDGTFTVTLQVGSGNRTVTSLDLRRSAGGVWDTLTNSFWVSGAANSLDDPLFNNSAGAVNFAVADGGSFNIFASDQNNIYLNSGSVFTLTVSFADGNFAIGNATLP